MRSAVLIAAILLIVFLAQMGVVEANPFSHPSIGIESPEAKVYQTTIVSVRFHVDIPLDTSIQHPRIVKMFYSLDGTANRTLSISNSEVTKFGSLRSSYVGTGNLVNLSNGTHSLEVYALDAQGKTMSYPAGRTFIVNSTAKSEQPLVTGDLTIALVLATIVATIGVIAVVTYRRKDKLTSKQSSLQVCLVKKP